ERNMSDLLALCRHESAHALNAHVCGMPVLGITINSAGRQGHTDLVYPLSTASIPKQYQQNPAMASVCLQQIVGTVMVGSLVDGRAPYGPDAEDLQAWQGVYAACGASLSDWLTLKRATESALLRWATRGPVREALSQMAAALSHVHRANEYGVMDLL